jgi:glycosyltransferase involved in cell wall biosynthesis
VRHLVYVAYFFPPTGGAGVQRSLKFIRYLPEHGWAATVVTVRDSRYWMQDPSLLTEIPKQVAVIRTEPRTAPALFGRFGWRRGVGDPSTSRSGRVQSALRKLSGFVLLPDPYAGWVPTAARAVEGAIAAGGILLTTSSPDSTHLVGLRLAGRGIPWIADFRDPWVRRMSFAPPTPLHRAIQNSHEARVVGTADRVVVTSEKTREDFLTRYPGLTPRRVVCIPNGYDEEDFPRDPPPLDRSFLIVHAGQLNPERPARLLLDHLETLFTMRPEAVDDTRVEMIGPRYREDEREVERRGLERTVRFLDGLPHRDVLPRILSARVLLLMEQESERGGLILPGKIFEYLRSGRPILGLVPHGAAWDLISRLDAGLCALPSDPRAGGAHLAGFYDAYRAAAAAGPPSAGAPWAGPSSVRPEVSCYERRVLAAQLSDLLDEVLREKHPA